MHIYFQNLTPCGLKQSSIEKYIHSHHRNPYMDEAAFAQLCTKRSAKRKSKKDVARQIRATIQRRHRRKANNILVPVCRNLSRKYKKKVLEFIQKHKLFQVSPGFMDPEVDDAHCTCQELPQPPPARRERRHRAARERRVTTEVREIHARIVCNVIPIPD